MTFNRKPVDGASLGAFLKAKEQAIDGAWIDYFVSLGMERKAAEKFVLEMTDEQADKLVEAMLRAHEQAPCPECGK